jgi:methylthioribose-1-phosphate isomerase
MPPETPRGRMEVLETVRWSRGRVRILDQTRLPDAEVYLELATVEEVADSIRSLAVRGAPAIGVAGALGLALAASLSAAGTAADLLEELERAAAYLASARPTAVNLRWAIDRSMSRLRERASAGDGPDEIRQVAREEAERILEEDLALSRAMAEHGAALLPPRARVLTHCNTGGLATAGGGTALGVVLEAARQGKEIFVHVDETRPLLQGARLTSWELERAGIGHAVNCDGAASWALRTRGIDAVLVGADRIAANGDTANKVGTLAVALAAREYEVPFYVVAPRSSFDLSLASGDRIPIEERDPGEVLSWRGHRVAPARANAWNPAFDVTPAALVTAWITERGVERPPFAP